MEAECFGGVETSQYGMYPRSSNNSTQPYQGANGGNGWKRERTRNAFLLVYDRKMLQSQVQDHKVQSNQSQQQQQQQQQVEELATQLAASSMSPAPPRCTSPPPPPPPPPLSVSSIGFSPSASNRSTNDGGGQAEGSGNSVSAVPVTAGMGKGRSDTVLGEVGGAVVAAGNGVLPRRRRQRKRFRAKVPEEFLHQIWQENVEFWR